MDGSEMRDEEAADQGLFRQASDSAEFDYGKRAGHALIAAAAGRHYRQRAAVHTRVRARGGKRREVVLEVIAVNAFSNAFAYGLAYGNAPVATQALAGDCRIQFDNLGEKRFYLFQRNAVGSLADEVYCKEGTVREGLHDGIAALLIFIQKIDSGPFEAGNAGMKV